MQEPTSPIHAEPAPSGKAIKELRTSLSLTQEAFAHAIAVTVSTVNRWENGHATPSRLAWKAIQALVRRQGTNPTPAPPEAPNPGV